MRPFRFAVFALAALVVLSLGFALIPAEKPAPDQPSFSEQARVAALGDALDLRAAGTQLASTGAADPAALEPVVTLLTIQARALLSPAPESAPAARTAAGTPSSPVAPPSAAELVQALARSGTARIEDAETADGGMARLLAGTGTAQLLAAGRLAAATAVPGPQAAPGSSKTAGAEDAVPGPATAFPCPSPSQAVAKEGALTTPAATQEALAAAIAAEQQAVYGYQAALPRLAPAEAGPASEFLGRHRQLAGAAEERLRRACGASVPQQPGYVLDPGFLAAPAAGLGRLEAATLSAYGDVVAVTEGQDRKWALSALQSAAARAARWGADTGAVPGLALDVDQLPALPAGTGLPAATGPAPSSTGS
jgi:hypothetical protein